MLTKCFMVLTCCLTFISMNSYAGSGCYDNPILDTKMLDDTTVEVTFEKSINGKKKYIFTETYCGQFYDSFICDYKTEDLPGWEISSDTYINTDWSIHYCLE